MNQCGRLLWRNPKKITSEYAPGKSGKKITDAAGEIRSFGIRPNGNFAKPRISQYTPTKILDQHIVPIFKRTQATCGRDSLRAGK